MVASQEPGRFGTAAPGPGRRYSGAVTTSRGVFIGMLGRYRSDCGVVPHIRASALGRVQRFARTFAIAGWPRTAGVVAWSRSLPRPVRLKARTVSVHRRWCELSDSNFGSLTRSDRMARRLLGIIAAAVAVGGPTWNAVVVAARLTLTPDRLRGRVNSIARLISGSMLSLGAFAGGLLQRASQTTTRVTYAGCLAVTPGARCDGQPITPLGAYAPPALYRTHAMSTACTYRHDRTRSALTTS
jgi:hypothetical protein